MYTQYVDPFYGNFTPELPTPNKTASKWFFLKAQVGNTLPSAVRPFGMMSACSYTGGYPTGYGPFLPNSDGRPKCFMDRDNPTALGFSHIHQSGTGYIGVFYNFSVLTPVSGVSHSRFDRYPLTCEKATPGYYSCKLSQIECEVTVTEKAAIYNFNFPTENNIIVFDPVINGIYDNKDTLNKKQGKLLSCELTGSQAVTGAKFNDGITVFTAVDCTASCKAEKQSDGRIVLSVKGKTAEVRLGLSFKSTERALINLNSVLKRSFEEVKCESEKLWEKRLSAIEIQGDDKAKTKFYSNFYRSLIKPVNVGEDNCFGAQDECYCDLATLWDASKTLLPLIFTLYPDVGTGLVRSFISSFQRFGTLPNSYLINGCDPSCNEQARALTVNSIYDAYLRGIKNVDWHEALEVAVNEVKNKENQKYFKGKPVSSYASHTVDLSIACFSIAGLAGELGETEIAEEFLRLSENWQVAYDKKTGEITEKSKFYEGCNLNYSYRLLPHFDKRTELAGGKEALERALDSFFGFDKEAAEQYLNNNDRHLLHKGMARRGFEGFNNETDMETPYCYCYIGRYDKTCEIVRSAEKYLYGERGTGALCGNDDSGALSSLYVVNSLGVFPCFGQNKIILGSPAFESAQITLANGNTLKITSEGFAPDKFVPDKIIFNSKTLEQPFITVTELMAGGELKFVY